VLTLTQPTEVGTVYPLERLRALSELCHAHDLKVHVDGARFTSAVASLGVTPAEASWKVGVDVLCLGGTKIGLPVGEALLFFDRELSKDFAYRCKQAGQLASKMRFLAAPWLGILEQDVWKRYAAHANAMARRLSSGLASVPGIELAFPTEANGVFVKMTAEMSQGIRAKGWHFYSFLAGCDGRFMCNWSTTSEEVDALVSDARQV
jgi:threonine aldolase